MGWFFSEHLPLFSAGFYKSDKWDGSAQKAGISSVANCWHFLNPSQDQFRK